MAILTADAHLFSSISLETPRSDPAFQTTSNLRHLQLCRTSLSGVDLRVTATGCPVSSGKLQTVRVHVRDNHVRAPANRATTAP